MSSLEALFCSVDDFCKVFIPVWRNQQLPGQRKQRNRPRSLTLSEQMTIVIAFHQSCYRNFKHFYLDHVCVNWSTAFPNLPSYQRFVEWMPGLIIPLCVYLKTLFGTCTGINFIDSTSVKVCHNRRISSHRVFHGIAARGKTSVDWFYGFKLHLVVNDQGELLNIHVTPGNTDDRQPVPELLQSLFGKVFADRGYVSKPLAQELFERFGIQFFAKPRRNMKNYLMLFIDKLLSRKRALIESIIDQLKNISQIEHSRQLRTSKALRSPRNFCVNLICGLIADALQPKKPAIIL